MKKLLLVLLTTLPAFAGSGEGYTLGTPIVYGVMEQLEKLASETEQMAPHYADVLPESRAAFAFRVAALREASDMIRLAATQSTRIAPPMPTPTPVPQSAPAKPETAKATKPTAKPVRIITIFNRWD
jgi:hypothetical protein